MPFFKNLRRRSKASFKTSHSAPEPQPPQTNGDAPFHQSSSSVESPYENTPASSIRPDISSPNLSIITKSNGTAPPTPIPQVPQRPVPLQAQSNRNSVFGTGALSVNGSTRTAQPTSPYSPRIISVSDNSWVHQKVLLVYGQIGEPNRPRALDGTLTVVHNQDAFPPISWPVSESHFKALVHLVPGPNKIRFDFTSPKLSSGGHTSTHSSWISINYLPLVNAPPLHLAILLGEDSDGTFDAIPDRIAREGNGLDTAVRKFRMAAYLWQAFTGEQMYRNTFGRRCFRFEEEWQTGTLSSRDFAVGQMRNEAKIHIIRTEKTVAELRDLQLAQQYGPATRKGELFDIAKEAVQKYFSPIPGQKRYVSVLLLDSHWDKEAQTITGHAALGSCDGDIKLGIFGSHTLQSYPCSLEEVVPAFSDCTRTDTDHVANDCNDAGSSWEAANIGIGAHLHETGHLFGCPHQENGVMLRDYVRLNRTFTTREPYSTRTKSPGQQPVLPADECGWHRLDTLRFRFHPCFRLPSDPPVHPDDSVQVWPVDNGKILITASSGIAFIELYTENDDVCKSYIEYVNGDSGNSGIPRQISVTESELRQQLTENKKSKKIRLEIFSGGLGRHTVQDISQLKAKLSMVKLPNGQVGYRGSKLGFSKLEGSEPQEVILENSFIQTKLMTSIKVYHGLALDGIEFCYEDMTSQLFGSKGGKPGGDEFVLDTRRGEFLMGFHVRAGAWIDGIEILTSLGRKSGVFGNPTGGSGHTLIPPRGYTVAGISGSVGSWVDGFSVIITR